MILKTKIITLVSIAIVLIGFYLIWHISPFAQYAEVSSLIQEIEKLKNYPAIPLICILIYLVAGLILFPMTLLNIAIVIVFGPWLGFCYAYLGNVLSAILTFSIVRTFGHKPFHYIFGQRIENISQLTAQKGVISVIFLRNTPISFAILSMVAGVSHINFKDFFWGNLIGIIPGITIVSFFTGKLIQILSHPNLQDIFVLLLGGICIILLWYLLFRKLKKSAVEE
ncbi:MAG TPA: VTT domain-containing protein [Desulfohalobiaceae bacterium]|nr:VTT domain-containing protein [Desulfohalobiaceae bacterium]